MRRARIFSRLIIITFSLHLALQMSGRVFTLFRATQWRSLLHGLTRSGFARPAEVADSTSITRCANLQTMRTNIGTDGICSIYETNRLQSVQARLYSPLKSCTNSPRSGKKLTTKQDVVSDKR